MPSTSPFTFRFIHSVNQYLLHSKLIIQNIEELNLTSMENLH